MFLQRLSGRDVLDYARLQQRGVDVAQAAKMWVRVLGTVIVAHGQLHQMGSRITPCNFRSGKNIQDHRVGH